MAFKRNKKRYSLDDRQKYHRDIMSKLIDKFTTSEGIYSKVNWDKVDSSIKKSPKLQYSSGFTSSIHTDLSGRSKSFIKGYNAARRAEEKAKTIKF